MRDNKKGSGITGFMAIGAFLLFIVGYFVGGASMYFSPNNQNEDINIINEGYIQRMNGKNYESLMVNNNMYSGICSDDFGLLEIGDYVLIEEDKSWCDDYRVTIIEARSQNV